MPIPMLLSLGCAALSGAALAGVIVCGVACVFAKHNFRRLLESAFLCLVAGWFLFGLSVLLPKLA